MRKVLFFLFMCMVSSFVGTVACKAKKHKSTDLVLLQPERQCSKKEWTLVMYMNTDGLAAHAIQNIHAIASALRSETTNVIVCCNYSDSRAWLWELGEGVVRHIKHIDNIGMHREMLPRLMEEVDIVYPAERYGICLWGHGSGAVDQVYNDETEEWEYEISGFNCEDGLCGLRGPSLGTSAITRGILYDNISRTCMTNADIVAACEEVARNLKRKLGVLITDACGMANIETANDISESVLFLTGTQDCQSSDGLAYAAMFNELNKHNVDPRDLVVTIVAEYGKLHNSLAPQGRHTYAGISCEAAADAFRAFHVFLELLNSLLSANGDLATDVYNIRCEVAASSLHADYIDMYEWIARCVDVLIAAGSRVPQNVLNEACLIQAAVRNAVVANVLGGGVRQKHGLSLYYPYAEASLVLNESDPWHVFIIKSMAILA